jgi:trk/ktr system potassium uptake protein
MSRIIPVALTSLALVPWVVLHGGFGLSGGQVRACGVATVLLLLGFLAELGVAWWRTKTPRAFVRERMLEFVTHGLLACGLLAILVSDSVLGLEGGVGAMKAIQMDLAILFFVRLLRFFRVLATSKAQFARVFVVSFIVIILIGAVLLWILPGATAPGCDLSFLDALFTATSATCVTGLVVHDTGAHFSRFGQGILLILIQVGGLGLMTFAAFFTMALGQGFGLKGRAMMRDLLNVEFLGRISRVLIAIMGITFLAEAVGAMLLQGCWAGPMADDERAWSSIFHSVSAFCNAGFALHGPDSLSAYRANTFLNVVVMGEIILGGLGFVVILNLLEFVPGLRRNSRSPLLEAEQGSSRRLGVQTRIVLLSSLVLIVLGTVLFWLFEKDNPATLGGLPEAERVGAAAFHSVSARTAGFNTVDMSALKPPSALLTIMLMFVGASPGSTGGGIKTVTLVVVLMTVISFARGRRRPEIMGRSIPFILVSRAVVILSCYAMLTLLTILVLTVTEPDKAFLPLAFEAASAFGTVGLSMGVTPTLSVAGKIVICVAMLVGRIGPLTLVVAMAQRKPRPDYEYPEARLMIG